MMVSQSVGHGTAVPVLDYQRKQLLEPPRPPHANVFLDSSDLKPEVILAGQFRTMAQKGLAIAGGLPYQKHWPALLSLHASALQACPSLRRQLMSRH